MIYIAIDNSTTTARKLIELIDEMPFATVYREFNKTTKKAFKEIEMGETLQADNVHDLLQILKQ